MHAKRTKKDNEQLYGKIIYKFPLSAVWTLLVTTHAEKFYYNNVDEVSVWQLPLSTEIGKDDELKLAHDKLEDIKDYVLIVLGMIRGARVPMDIIKDVEEKLGLVLKKRSTDDGVDGEQRQERFKEKEEEYHSGGNYNVDEEEEEEEGEEDKDEDEENQEEEEDHGLNLSEIEDLLEEPENQDLPTLEPVEEDESLENDELVKEYISKYPQLSTIVKNSATTLKQAISFIQFLESSEIDPYTSYDLEIEELATKPEFVVYGCNHIDDRIRSGLWDEYCRIIGNEMNDQKGGNIHQNQNDQFSIDMMKNDTLQYINFLNSLQEKGLKIFKFYTDFNRGAVRYGKVNNDATYGELCKKVPMTVRQVLYNKFSKFSQMDGEQRVDYVFKLLNGILGSINVVVDGFNSDEKIVKYAELFFLKEEELRKVSELRTGKS